MDGQVNIINTDEIIKDPCWDAHKIGLIIPDETMQQFDGKTCNCGKFIWKWELCGCPGRQDHKLKMHINEG